MADSVTETILRALGSGSFGVSGHAIESSLRKQNLVYALPPIILTCILLTYVHNMIAWRA